MSSLLTVRKLDEQGREVWSYQGRLLAENDGTRVLEARFDRGPLEIASLMLEPGDRMIEYFYTDRWFNIFEIYNHADELKGWYCNVAQPAEFTAEAIEQRDLALDLVVSPFGETRLLDQDEFEKLPLSAAERELALAGLDHLRRMIESKSPPFDKIQAK